MTGITTQPSLVTTSAATKGKKRSNQRVAWLFLAPFLVLFGMFFIAPMLYALVLSLFVNRRIGGNVFVGLSNYVSIMADSTFWTGFGRVLVYGVVAVPSTLFLALALALILDSGRVRGRSLFQLGFFLPFAIPSVISALLWGYMYGSSFGVLTQITQSLHLGLPAFLSPEAVLPSLANIAVWGAAGANMVILYAALRSIPPELFEAARLDGASEWATIWHIKIPMVRSTLGFTSILSVIGALQLFNEPSILKSNAAGAITSGFTPNMYAQNLVGLQQHNYAAALTFFLAAIIIVATLCALLIFRRRP